MGTVIEMRKNIYEIMKKAEEALDKTTMDKETYDKAFDEAVSKALGKGTNKRLVREALDKIAKKAEVQSKQMDSAMEKIYETGDASITLSAEEKDIIANILDNNHRYIDELETVVDDLKYMAGIED